jgi:ferric-dicitrate binding protein FerR (iron transport regulator)
MQVSGDERKRIAWQAATWLSLLEESPTREQRTAFLVWLERSPLHGEIYLDVAAQFPEILESRGVAKPANEEMAPALPNLFTRYPTPAPPVYLRKHGWARVTIFSAVVAIIAYGVHQAPSRPVQQALDAKLTYADAGTFELERNSIMTLDNQSKVEVQKPRDPAETRVHVLQGHAAFAGVHDASAPLRVFSNNIVVEVLGTSFDVYNKHDSTTIKVTQGKVHVIAYCQAPVRAPASEADVTEGEMVEASTETCSDPLQVRSMPDARYQQVVDSSNDWLDLQNRTIQEAVQEFNQRGQHLVVSDPGLGSQRITGNFQASQIESFLKILKRDYHARVRRDTTSDGSRVIYLSLYTRK